jgi:hypothetical protein
MLSTHLGQMDAKVLDKDGMSDHDRKQYLAWDASLRRLLRQLGPGVAERPQTLAQLLATPPSAPARSAAATPAAA